MPRIIMLDMLSTKKRLRSYWFLVGIAGISFWVHIWGFRKLLPFTPEVDEPEFVRPAVLMASSGNLNPGWFGHPGSTVIYPLAGLYHVWNALLYSGKWFVSDPALLTRFEEMPAEFYLLGRLLSVSYSVLSIPLIYHLGKLAFDQRAALIGTCLAALVPVTILHAQLVRTDSGALFFGLLGLWGCAKLYQHPSYRYQLIAGMAIGFAVGTRYVMIVLAAALAAVDALILWRYRKAPGLGQKAFSEILAGAIAVAVGFAASTPYFLVDLDKSYKDFLGSGVQQGHLGADGLSALGNLRWYLFSAIPQSLGWLQAGCAAIGLLAALVGRRDPLRLVLIFFAGSFLVVISLSPLHWQRWIIQILPVLALFAANAIGLLAGPLANGLRSGSSAFLQFAFTIGISLMPAYEVFLIGACTPSTRLQAREWILMNLPPGSKIAQEWYGAPLPVPDYDVSVAWSLAERDSVDYARDDYDYLIFSSSMYGRYYAEPERYSQQVAMYEQLFKEGHLINQIEPASFCSPAPGVNYGGPIIRIYALTPP